MPHHYLPACKEQVPYSLLVRRIFGPHGQDALLSAVGGDVERAKGRGAGATDEECEGEQGEAFHRCMGARFFKSNPRPTRFLKYSAVSLKATFAAGL